MNEEFYKKGLKMLRLANRGAKKAQEENHRLGLPNVYSLEGKIVYVYPDGTVKAK
jgi:hypothetical protein